MSTLLMQWGKGKLWHTKLKKLQGSLKGYSQTAAPACIAESIVSAGLMGGRPHSETEHARTEDFADEKCGGLTCFNIGESAEGLVWNESKLSWRVVSAMRGLTQHFQLHISAPRNPSTQEPLFLCSQPSREAPWLVMAWRQMENWPVPSACVQSPSQQAER